MRTAYFDCFSGASGDMILGALVAAGLSPQALRADLARLPVGDYELDIREVTKQGFAAVKVEVKLSGTPGHRHLRDIHELISAADLPPVVKDRARRIFSRLAEAEAKVHGTTPDQVHFHEVGAVDAIVDVVGSVIGLHRLGIERIICSPIPTGSGTIACRHGVMPVPAPATAELLAGVPLAETDETGELTTPTGAAILTTLADRFGPLPAMTVQRVGFGAGTRDGQHRPNVLRLFVGEAAEIGGAAAAPEEQTATTQSADEIVVLEANIDDATGEQIGHAFDALFSAGALDVYTTAVTMKKNRPGVLLTVLVPYDKERVCEDVLFAETTTFGIRRHSCARRKLARTMETVTTRFGDIRVKVGRGGSSVIAAPEYEDCAKAARECGVPLRDVMFEARRAWSAGHEAKP